jgi:anti-sigma B factor antagonist/stage II sporulation protein AA (anti-sigma F factor antagonist)
VTVAHVRFAGDGSWPVAHLDGEIDLSNVDELIGALETSIGNDAMGLVLDISAVTYLDSTGLRLIFRVARQMQDRQQELRLVVPDTALIWRVLRLSGVIDVVSVFETVPDALRPAGASHE